MTLTLILSLSVGIFAILGVRELISEIDPSRLEKSTIIFERHKTSFEKESPIDREELKFYMLFDSQKIGDEKLRAYEDDLVIIDENLNINSLLENNCQETYCLQIYKKFEELPPLIWKGLIGIEDLRFLEHPGFDFTGILRAFVKNLISMSFTQGASTITQQLMKNTYFTNKKSITRKIKEILASAYIESIYDKDKILEFYLNNIVWGSTNGIKIKGAFAASTYLFGKKLENISQFEMAILISLLKGPYFYHPLNHTERLRERVEVVYKRLIDLNLIADSYSSAWGDIEWKKFKESIIAREERGLTYAMFRTLQDHSLNMGDYEKFVINLSVWKLLRKLESLWGRENIGIKAVIRKNGESQAWSYYSKYERKQTEAIESERHQIGSLLKPLVYQYFIQQGLDWNKEIGTAPITLNLLSGKWEPSEASRNLPAEVTLMQALLWSLNRPLIKVAQEVGFDGLETFLKNYIPELLSPLSQYPSQLLGSIELPIAEVEAIYQKFFIQECEIKRSNEDYVGPMEVLSDPQQNTLRNKKDKIMSNLRFFAKTGTSNKGLDNWFVFNDGMMHGVFWVGYEGDRSIEDKRTFGSSTAYELYRNLVVRRGQRMGDFDCELVHAIK